MHVQNIENRTPIVIRSKLGENREFRLEYTSRDHFQRYIDLVNRKKNLKTPCMSCLFADFVLPTSSADSGKIFYVQNEYMT